MLRQSWIVMNKKLKALQTDFIDGMKSLHADTPVLQAIVSTERLPNLARLKIYHDSVYEIFHATLKKIYPVCHTLVGNEFFYHMALVYSSQNSSTSPNLADYGNGFPEFIAAFKPAASVPYLSDIARLDYAFYQCSHSLDSHQFNIENLQYVQDSDAVIFTLPKNTVFIESNYPILDIWEFCQSAQSEELNIDRPGQRVMVWASDLITHIDPVTECQWHLLSAIAQGLSLGDICDTLQSQHQLDAATLLPQLVQQGWIAGIKE